MATRLVLLAIVLPRLAVSASDHAGHGHGGDEPFEWAGIFETPENTYLWTAQKVEAGGQMRYADATMKMAALPASAATDGVLHTLEGEGEHALSMNCSEVEVGEVIVPREDACFNLHFKQDWWQSLFSIDTTGLAAVAFFTEHVPTEFENTAHYLKDDHGDDIEPVAELPEEVSSPTANSEGEEEDHWGAAILVAILVNLVTLVGVVLAVPAISRASKSYAAEFDGLTAGLAAGALLACTFFLLLFEATHLIASGHKEEVQQIWRWGIMILAGFILPSVFQLLTPLLPQAALKENKGEVEDGEKPSETSPTQTPAEGGTRLRLITGVLMGDFMHNLCDGFFVGAAFMGCGTSFGWSVAWGTIAHELAQELSDYVVLTGPGAMLHPVAALGLNFLSGTGVLLGVIIVLSGEVSNTSIGLLLAFGGGTYLHIGATECMPRIYNAKLSTSMRALAILMFVLGAIAIGLVLLDHEHCVPSTGAEGGGGADAHAGHGH